MRKLIRGIVRFREQARADYKVRFQALGRGQRPDTLFIACSDSRVVPNLFASTDPGDLFVVRNPGNIVPPEDPAFPSAADGTAAAIEFALTVLSVTDVVVCGHSDCGAMKAILEPGVRRGALDAWLHRGEVSRKALADRPGLAQGLAPQDRLAQAHALVQLENLATHGAVREALSAGRLRLHAWWFDLAEADVHAWEPREGRFTLLDAAHAERLLARLDGV